MDLHKPSSFQEPLFTSPSSIVPCWFRLLVTEPFSTQPWHILRPFHRSSLFSKLWKFGDSKGVVGRRRVSRTHLGSQLSRGPYPSSAFYTSLLILKGRGQITLQDAIACSYTINKIMFLLLHPCYYHILLIFLQYYKDFIYLFLERGERREKERERKSDVRNTDRLPLTCAPTGDRTWNPGICPNWESNPRPLRDDTLPTEPHQSGLLLIF